MADDIRFYDFDLNLLYILPQNSKKKGYISINATQEFNGSGSLEIVFEDEDLKSKIAQYKDNIIVIWNGFQGFLTSYKFNKENLITGMSLNGLLHRIVIPATIDEISGDVETLARSALALNAPWLTLGSKKIFSNVVSYQTDTYRTADTYIQELLNLDTAGYKITADIPNKRFVFDCLKSCETELMLSESNLNAYDFDETYINKNLAFGGWYKEEQEKIDGVKPDSIWKYISVDNTKSSIYKIDTVLKATSATEAMNELKSCISEYEVSTQVKDIKHGINYNLGDIVRVQHKGITTTRFVSGISMWCENVYGEQPILTESRRS